MYLIMNEISHKQPKLALLLLHVVGNNTIVCSIMGLCKVFFYVLACNIRKLQI